MRPAIMALGGLGPPAGTKDGSPCCPIPAETHTETQCLNDTSPGRKTSSTIIETQDRDPTSHPAPNKQPHPPPHPRSPALLFLLLT